MDDTEELTQFFNYYKGCTCLRAKFLSLKWVISSAGRATRLHRVGRRFDPVITHHLNQEQNLKIKSRNSSRNYDSNFVYSIVARPLLISHFFSIQKTCEQHPGLDGVYQSPPLHHWF